MRSQFPGETVDTATTNMTVKSLRRTDNDYALSWIKPHGAGRVFYSAIGHRTEHWWNPTILRSPAATCGRRSSRGEEKR